MRQYTAQDAEAFTKAEEQLSKNGLDKWTQEGTQRNADLIDQFFKANLTLPVTLQNIYRAVEERKSEFAWLSQAQVKWYETAQHNPELGNQLAAHLATQGSRPGQLVSDGDSLFENLTLLFTEINSRRESASPQAIANAENRIANRPQKQLIRISQPRRTEPVSRAAKEDDSTSANWLGSDLVKNADGSFRSKTPAEQRADREAAENAKQTQTATALSESDQQWRSMALDACNYGTHSQQAQIRQVFDQYKDTTSWREVYDRVNQTRNTLKRQREQMPA